MVCDKCLCECVSVCVCERERACVCVEEAFLRIRAIADGICLGE